MTLENILWILFALAALILLGGIIMAVVTVRSNEYKAAMSFGGRQPGDGIL